MIDTHCHLNFHSFKKDYAEIAKAANDLGVKKIINVGAKLDSSRRAVKIASEIPFCFAAVGVHPHHAEEMLDSRRSLPRTKLRGWNDKNRDGNDKKVNGKNNDISFLEVEKELTTIIEEDFNSTKKIVAIGECGLDYHEYNINTPTVETRNCASLQENNEIQKNLLDLHFRLAKKYNLPLIIHCREAYSDLLRLLQTANCKLPTIPGVIHCFQGNLDELKQFLELGFYIGYDGYITYGDKVQNANLKVQNDNVKLKMKSLDSRRSLPRMELRGGNDNSCISENPPEIRRNPDEEKKNKLTQYESLVMNTPLNRILTETDAPWLTPEPLRGTRNSPTNIKIITEKIGEIKGLPFEEVDRITSENAEKLFNI